MCSDTFENLSTCHKTMFKAKCPKKDNSSALTRQACIWFAKSEEIFLNIDTDLDHGSCTMVQNRGLCNEKLLRTCKQE